MNPRAMDSLDIVEMTMLMEEIFAVDISDFEAEKFDGPKQIVDCLKVRLSDKRPNKQAVAMLKDLAKKQRWPELADGLEAPWRREQIAAIIRELFRDNS